MTGKERENLLITMRKAGKSLKEMSQAAGMSTNRICIMLSKAGCKKYVIHGVEEEINVDELHFAQPREITSERFVIQGKHYTDITHQFSSF